MPRESLEEYLERKRQKGTLGQEKPGTLADGTPVTVLTGYCPCTHCGHELMPECDPDHQDGPGCSCCDEVCT